MLCIIFSAGRGLFFKIGAQTGLSCFTDVDKQIRRVIDALLLLFASFGVVILSHGKVKIKLPTHDLLVRLNIVLWLRVHVNSYGFILFLMS